MGNWQLEVGKMALYIFLPVGAFYAFHQVIQYIVIFQELELNLETTISSILPISLN